MTPRKWTPDRCARFAWDWNAGLSSSALQEKYGVRRPFVIARWLRDQDYFVKSQRDRGKAE